MSNGKRIPGWLDELITILVLVAGLVSFVIGLVLIHPGLLAAVAGLAAVALAVHRIRRGPGVPPVPEQAGLRNFDESDPDDDGRMEVRPL